MTDNPLIDLMRIPADLKMWAKEKGHDFFTYDPLTILSEMGEDPIDDTSYSD